MSAAPFCPPLRILAAMARPRSVEPLDLEQELLHLRQSWSLGTDAHVDALERATADAFRNRLCERWDILHFMGHGGFDESRREGYLVFEDEDGSPKKIRDESLAILLQGGERPKLVVLNACETARTAVDGARETATGAAPMLVRAGVPAVVAMLNPIFDDAALLFNRALHSRLAAGDAMDVAVAEGRRAIHSQMPGMEWAKPVLFMRVPDGRLFTDHLETPQAGSPNIAEVEIREIESKDIVLGGVICEGDAVFGGSAPGEVSLQADRTKSDRFILGGKVFFKGDSGAGSSGGGTRS